MEGYYENFNYITTIKVEYYEPVDSYILNKEYATYKTKKYTILQIEDIHGKIVLNYNEMYPENKIYAEINDNEIYFVLKKNIVHDIIINNLHEYSHTLFMERFYKLLKNHFPNGISGVCRLYYTNGILKGEYFHNNGIIEGNYICYFENGNIRMIQPLINGKVCGFYTSYSNDSKPKIYSSFINNLW